MKAKPLEGKVALVTGGSRGIGAAVAFRLAEQGASVAITYHKGAAEAEETLARIKSAGSYGVMAQADMADPVQVAALVDWAADSCGRLDILASCAGIEHFGALQDLTPDDVHDVFAINTYGQLFAAQSAARHLTADGRIILTSSLAARRTVFEHTLYAASKAAVEAMARNLSVELGQRGITINAVAPGATATDMAAANGARYQPPELGLPTAQWLSLSHALGRVATANEVAGAYVFLAGPDGAYFTGRTLPVDNCIF
jgi:tetrahydroxynaphthalene reductase